MNNFTYLITGLLIALMFAFGVYLAYSIEDSIDWKKIHLQLSTNKTYTDSLSCDQIKFQLSSVKELILTPHKDIEKDFENLSVERNCK